MKYSWQHTTHINREDGQECAIMETHEFGVLRLCVYMSLFVLNYSPMEWVGRDL